MKAHIEPSNNSLKMEAVSHLHDGKVHKAKRPHHPHSSPYKEEDNAEIKEYLNKLQELVPCMPKNKKLSKLEVITYVIDYIQDLSETLGLPPSPSSLPSDSSDEEDEDDDDLHDFDMERPEEISSKVTLSLINKKSSFTTCSEEPIIVSSRQPLSVIPNPEKVVKGEQ